MELSFELGIPEEELARRLTERSFVLYQAYAAKWRLPNRRVELMLARVCHTFAAIMGGGKDLDIEDFLFDPVDDTPSSPQASREAAREFFGFSPSNKA